MIVAIWIMSKQEWHFLLFLPKGAVAYQARNSCKCLHSFIRGLELGSVRFESKQWVVILTPRHAYTIIYHLSPILLSLNLWQTTRKCLLPPPTPAPTPTPLKKRARPFHYGTAGSDQLLLSSLMNCRNTAEEFPPSPLIDPLTIHRHTEKSSRYVLLCHMQL